MRRTLLCLLMFPVLVLAHTIYKQVDEDGSVTYSDEPMTDGAQPMDLPEISVVDRTPAPVIEGAAGDGPQEGGEGEEEAAVYTRLEILSPRSEETFWLPEARIYAVVQVSPSLAPNHSLRYALNGQNLANTRSVRLQLDDMVRGAHQLTVRVVDAQGRTQASAEPVTFYVQQPSAIPPANPAPRAPRAPGAG